MKTSSDSVVILDILSCTPQDLLDVPPDKSAQLINISPNSIQEIVDLMTQAYKLAAQYHMERATNRVGPRYVVPVTYVVADWSALGGPAIGRISQAGATFADIRVWPAILKQLEAAS